jgi:hypothetical protein
MPKSINKALCLTLGSVLSLLLLFWPRQNPTEPEQPVVNFQVVGIALSANDATVSRRYSDGVFEDLGSVQGLGEYTELMERLSSWDITHARYVQFQ